MECGGDELGRHIGIHHAALFYDAFGARDPVDASKSNAGLDDESGADNLEHHGDDELDRVIGSDLLWNWCARHGDQRAGCGYVYRIDELSSKRLDRRTNLSMECGGNELSGNFGLYDPTVLYNAERIADTNSRITYDSRCESQPYNRLNELATLHDQRK